MSERARVLQLYTFDQIRAALLEVGADSALAEKAARAEFRIVKLERVSLSMARLLYQELTMEGGLVVTAPRLEHTGAETTDVLLCATRYQLKHLNVRLRLQADDTLQWLAEQIERALTYFVAPPPPLLLNGVTFDWTRPYVMGILNLTPDSFSGDGVIQAGATPAQWTARAVARAQELIAAGADILDLGGASTRPGAAATDAATEMERLLPTLRALAAGGVPLSVDTQHARVAAAALEAGAALVNDVTGLRGDADMARVIAAHNAAAVLMHNGKPRADARDFIGALLDDLRAQMDLALAAGIAAPRILLDPGLGFGKTVAQNLELLNRLGEFRALGCALVIGPSRKGFIGQATGAPVHERQAGTAAAVALGIARGAQLVRVHDVALMAQTAKMADAITRAAARAS